MGELVVKLVLGLEGARPSGEHVDDVVVTSWPGEADADLIGDRNKPWEIRSGGRATRGGDLGG
jgi:hypothetical protein